MRPVAVLFFAVVVIGGLAAYLQLVRTDIQQADFVEQMAPGEYFVELTLTFDADANIFNGNKALILQVDGREILAINEFVPSGVLPRQKVTDLKIGRNEFAVNVQPKDMGFGQSNTFSIDIPSEPQETDAQHDPSLSKPSPVALRLRVYRDANVISEGTFWSEPGLPIVATLMLEIEADEN